MTINTTPAPISGPAAAGPPGPQGLWPEGEWAAGTKIKNTVLSHNNRVWVANKTTTQEPSDSASDWDLWIDAQGAELAGAYAEAADVASVAAASAKSAAEAARDSAIAAERRIRTQSLGTFANDAAAVAWAAAQTPPITIVTGSSYLNSTTDVFRYAVVSAGPTITWHDVTEDEAAQAALATASASAAAASLQDFLNRYVGAFSSAPTYVGGSPPWVNGALYWNTLAGKFKVWTGATWVDSDATAQQAATDATGARDAIYGFWCGAAAADPTTKIGGGALTTACIYFNTVSGKLRTYATGVWRDYDKDAQDAAALATSKASDANAAKVASEAARDAAAGSATGAGNSKAAVDASLLQAISYAALAQAGATSVSAQTGLSILAAAQRAIALMTDGAATFIYDTRRDSDGGAWVDKCVSQSWATETLGTATRGASAKFPKMALIVARNSASGNPAITIYDATDPTVPMWMVFTGANQNSTWLFAGASYAYTSMAALNGKVFVGVASVAGMFEIDFVSDGAIEWEASGNYPSLAGVSARNSAFTYGTRSAAIASSSVNSIAATIAPNTPLNPLRCNLPNPTVAVGTNGGCSVIRWDGVVCNSTSSLAYSSVTFDDKGNLWSLYSGDSLYVCSPATYQAASFNITTMASFTLSQLLISSPSKVTNIGSGMVAVAGSTGLARIKLDPANPAQSLINIKTATYDTGWMVLGKTVLAMAESSGDVSAYAAQAVFSDDFSSYANTAALKVAYPPNGTYTGTETDFTLSGGAMVMTRGTGSITGCPTLSLSGLTVGRALEISFDVSGTSATVAAISGQTGLAQTSFAVGRAKVSFVPTGTAGVIAFWPANLSSSATIDNIQIVAVALDRSGSQNNPKVVGNPTRAVVATGADTAGLTGWGVGNYATGAAIALATADFEFPVSIVGASITGTQTYLSHGYYTGGAYSGARVLLQSTTSTLTATFHDGTNSASISVASALAAGGNYDLRLIYRSALTRFELWSNGVLLGTAARGSVGSLTNASANLFIGIDPALANPTVSTVILALIRAWTYATTPDQIAFMRADEKARFNANAQSLLTGANVQGVAYDPDTDQVAAANSTGGCDVFKGSVRVANDNSTLAINRVRNSALTGISVGAIAGSYIDSGNSLPISVGGGLSKSVTAVGNGWFDLRINGTANASGYFSIAPLSYSLATAANGQSWTAAMQLALVAGSWANISSPTMLLSEMSAGGSGLASSSTSLSGLNSTLALKTVSRTFNQASVATAHVDLEGTFANGAVIDFTIRIYQPFFAQVASFTAFSDGLSNSANAKAVAMSQGKVAVITAAGVDVWIPAAPGLRETAESVGASKRAVYDPTRSLTTWTTANATPVNVPLFIVPEGKSFDFVVRASAKSFDGAYTNKLKWSVIEGQATRPVGGTAYAKGSTPTLIDPASSTAGISIGYDTTNNLVYATLTGLPANLRWNLACEIAWTDIQ